jgi:hypothetical protein
MLDKSPFIEFIERRLQFLLRVHDNRATPCNWFTQRFARDEHKSYRLEESIQNHLAHQHSYNFQMPH